MSTVDQTKQKKMKNDMMDPSSALGSYDLAQLAELSKFKIERVEAQNWASMKIKFLVYDDTNIAVNGYDSDDEDSMMNLAIEQSRGDDPELPEPGPECAQSQRSQISISAKTQANEEQKFSCRICSSYPEFPHKWRPTKFRLVQPVLDHPELFDGGKARSVDVCMHYVAVSYTWPPVEEKPTVRHYQVRDLDGNIRLNRALDVILDRAVDFANSCGLRMIWIDQECLPQPSQNSSKADQDEQELGIQSMDMVYNRAMVTVGLLDMEITNQEQLTALETLLYSDQATRQKAISHQFCTYIIEFFLRTSHDRWFSRAWVIQEALCAGDKLVLNYRRGSGLSFPSKFRYGYQAERESRPYHSLDNSPQKIESSHVCMQLREFWMVIDDMKHFLERDFMSSGNQLIRLDNDPVYSSLDARSALIAADSLLPRFVKVNHPIQRNLKIYSKGHYGKRPTTDAAGALTLLKSRHCLHDSDRLAIVANMCDYDIRLDTRAVEHNCSYLSWALFALALNNGDLSLLVPEAYQPYNLIYADCSADPKIPALFREFASEARLVNHCKVRNFINSKTQSAQPGTFTSAGLRVPAYIWSVEEEIDFTPIQIFWADTWEKMQCWRFIIDIQKYETQEQFEARKKAIVQRFSQPGISHQALREFRQLGNIPADSVVWNGLDNSGVQVGRYINSPRVRRETEIQASLARIIFDILRYVLEMSKRLQHAQGLANSIWQSVRVDQVPGSNELLPDEISDSLFSHQDVVRNPYATLQLNETMDDNIAQLWFVDRIMIYGKIWCGTYKRPGRQSSIPPDQELGLQAHPSTSSALQGIPFDREQKFKSIIERQITRQVVASLAMSTDIPGASTTRYPLATMMEIMKFDFWSEDAERRREQYFMSAFDVDGPCQVATPYNPDWEILPRPDLRSMSVCWVVESKEGASSTEEVLHEKQNEKISDLGEHDTKRQSNAVPCDDLNAYEDTNNNQPSHPAKNSNRECPAYQVLRKVKGLWQIMHLPSQEFIFS